jgi:hypothetical protein
MLLTMRATEPTVDLAAVVRRGRTLLAGGIQRGLERGILRRVDDGMFAPVLGPEQIEALLAKDLPIPVGSGAPSDAPSSSSSSTAGLRALLARAGASAIAEDLLAIVIAAESDPVSQAMVSFLRGGETGAALTVGGLALALDPRPPWEVLAEIGTGSPLRARRLIDVTDKPGELMSGAAVRVAPRLVRWLTAPRTLAPELASFCTLYPSAGAPILQPAALEAVEAVVAEVASFVRAQRETSGDGASARRARCDMILRGPRGSGRREIAREACRRLGVPLLQTRVGALRGQPFPTEALQSVLREALLLDAQLLLEEGDDLAILFDDAHRLQSALDESTASLLMTSNGREQPRTERRVVVRDVGTPSVSQREAAWREILPEASGEAEEIASLFRIGIGAILRVSEAAQLRAGLRANDGVRREDLVAGVRGEFETDLSTVATRIVVSQRWEDLVAPDDVRRTLSELVDQIRHRSTVLGRWGFARKLGRGLGTVALFTGEPGTGKSMAAGLIARTLDLELYQVDLARITSKWLGETEKNLGRLFDAAEAGHVLLVFDEADALLGKRTVDVKSSNDRYANLETNYVLQRLEAFHGAAILTSNLETSIDPAFSRRLAFSVRFPFPDEEQRAELWRRMMPAELPLAGDVDVRALAHSFEIAGGHIRNIVLRAAYLAASRKAAALEMADLQHAAQYEYRDRGMLAAKGRLPK